MLGPVDTRMSLAGRDWHCDELSRERPAAEGCDPRDPDDAVRLANFARAATDADRTAAIRSFCHDGFTISLPDDGGARSVTIPFRINADDFRAKLRLLDQALRGSPAARCAPRVVCGRPTPAELEAVLAELVRRNPTAFAPDRTREQIRDYLSGLGIGIDCTGTVAQAFYASRHVDERAGRQRFGLYALHDGVFNGIDKNPAFARLGDPAAVRPGDIIVLGPPPDDEFGHKVIVVDARAGVDANRPVVLISVMSSWGGEGPAERTWVYDPATTSWGDLGGAFTDGTPFQSPASGPWDHPLRGIYHAR